MSSPNNHVNALRERRALLLHVGWEEVAGGDVDGEPAGVEPADQVVRAAVAGRPRRAVSPARHGRRVPRRPSLGGHRPTPADSGDHDQRRVGNRPAGQHRDCHCRACTVEEGGGPQQRHRGQCRFRSASASARPSGFPLWRSAGCGLPEPVGRRNQHQRRRRCRRRHPGYGSRRAVPPLRGSR